MEHRCDNRKLISCDVIISDCRLGSVKGRVRNISLNGMLVAISDSAQQINGIIDVSFPIEGGDSNQQCQAKALVVHQQSGCLGLMFSELDPGVKQMLRKMLYGYATVTERAYLYQSYRA
ncbi:MAG: PilZ domain-containing protein [Candidatus Thiodiazotropha sp.]|jgi:hypothetical protein